MIAIGADPHKAAHVLAAVVAATGEQLGCEPVKATTAGLEQALTWGRRLGPERVWAIEDCRHVSGRLERFLVARGERVVRVPPRLTAAARRALPGRGKSDRIDALAVARAALQQGLDKLPAAHLDERALEIRLLLDHREHLVNDRRDDQCRLRWHLVDAFGELAIPAGGLDRKKWLDPLERKLARVEQTARVRICRDHLRQIRQRTRRINELETEITALVADYAPQLLAETGCGPLTAAKLIGEIAGPARFKTDAQLARAAGVAPIPASSGNTQRHRLDRGGNRQLNLAFHRIAITKARYCPETQTYLARKQTENKTRKEAIRCLKRHLVRHYHRLLTTPPALT
jgi:transposase